MLIATGQMLPRVSAVAVPVSIFVHGHEALFNQRQHGCVIAYSMGNVMLFGEGRYRQKRNAESELVKAGALVRKWPCRIGRKGRTERFFDAQADGALRASAGLRAGW